MITTARSRPAEGIPKHFVQADIATREGVNEVIKAMLERFGGLDILVNSVGGSTAPSGGVLALTDDDWQRTFDLNLMSAVRLDRGIFPSMLQQGSGVIIHISSIQRTLPLFEATLAYAAATGCHPFLSIATLGSKPSKTCWPNPLSRHAFTPPLTPVNRRGFSDHILPGSRTTGAIPPEWQTVPTSFQTPFARRAA